MKFAYIDLEQAESRLVGAIEWNLFHDGTYLDACESGDLHTSCRSTRVEHLPWTGDFKADKELAERPFYRQHSYRHMAKVLGHGTNYNGKPYTMAKFTHIPESTIAEFQFRYFASLLLLMSDGTLAWPVTSVSTAYSRRSLVGDAGSLVVETKTLLSGKPSPLTLKDRSETSSTEGCLPSGEPASASYSSKSTMQS